MSPRGRPSRTKGARARVAHPAPSIAQTRILEVRPEEAGERLDRIVAARLPELSRARVQALMKEGLVFLAGSAARAAQRPKEGMRIEVRVPHAQAIALSAVRLDLPVLYEDAALLVIDKPAGLAVHPGAGGERETVVHGLLNQVRDLEGIGGELRPGIVHRLDKDTSGCLVVAKTERALRGLQAAFKSRAVDKRYRALVHGAPPEVGELDTFFGRHPTQRTRMSSHVREGRRALTRYRVLARGVGAAYLEVELLTGRTHQIRAHLSDAGFPLLGDTVYGGTRREARLPRDAPPRRAAELLGRQALHAFRLSFLHPLTGVRIDCTAPLPPDLRAALGALGIAPG